MIGVVSHDAGGAEVVSSYLRRESLAYVATLEGPAAGVFERKLGAVRKRALNETIHESAWVLCGSSWQSELEWHALDVAKRAGKRTVVFLDHWVNYRERFERDGRVHWPDEIWVGDEAGIEIARRVFDGLDLRVTLVPNPYFLDIQEDLRAAELRLGVRAEGGTGRVLLVTEPTSEHARLRFGNERHWGYTEFDAVRYFLTNATALGMGYERVVLRPHPAETTTKYAEILAAYEGRVQLSQGRPLVEDIVESDVVAGCTSMAMVVGLLARKRVLSCVPPGGMRCELPQAEIERMEDLLATWFASQRSL